jgi:gas vesicle protein
MIVSLFLVHVVTLIERQFVLFGIGVGVAAGFAVSLRNRDDQSVKNNTIDGGQPTGAQSELQRELETMKQCGNTYANTKQYACYFHYKSPHFYISDNCIIHLIPILRQIKHDYSN